MDYKAIVFLFVVVKL